jgi:hypothetical protein
VPSKEENIIKCAGYSFSVMRSDTTAKLEGDRNCSILQITKVLSFSERGV